MTEPSGEFHSLLVRVDDRVIVACIFPAAKFYNHLCSEGNDKNSYYYNPDNHRQGC